MSPLAPRHCKFFSKLFGRDFHTQEAFLHSYSYDSTQEKRLPDAVIFPRNEEEISQLLGYCNEHVLPVIVRGAGSGMSGGAIGAQGGIILAMEKYFNQILEIDTQNMLVRLQPGVRNSDLQQAVERLNLFYPPDPASKDFCTIGGNVAENAGGMRAAKYGITKDYVLALRAILANGEIISAGKKTIKDVAGYNLVGTLIGSEGTLAILSEITLKLLAKPKFSRIGLGAFGSIQDAMNAVYESMRSGVTPVAMEFLDTLTLRAVAQLHLSAPIQQAFQAKALLIFEVDAMIEEMIAHQIHTLQGIFEKNGCQHFIQAKDASEGALIWSIRRNASQSITQYGKKKLNEDITVPRSELGALLAGIEEISQRYHFLIPCFGHAGDGNVHVNVMLPDTEPKTLARGYEAVEEIFRLAIRLHGTLSGEHGIGLAKANFMHLAFSPSELDCMRALKRAFDPNNILNPHKMGL